jgi:hypothetical protein
VLDNDVVFGTVNANRRLMVNRPLAGVLGPVAPAIGA